MATPPSDRLNPKKEAKLKKAFARMQREALTYKLDLERRLSNANFLTNGGGAVAAIAYVGTAGRNLWLLAALTVFVIGVILTMIEIRILMDEYRQLFKTSRERRRGFLKGTLTLDECFDPKALPADREDTRNKISTAAQVTFVIGALLGGIGVFILRP